MPPEGFEPPTTGSKPVVISISPRERNFLNHSEKLTKKQNCEYNTLDAGYSGVRQTPGQKTNKEAQEMKRLNFAFRVALSVISLESNLLPLFLVMALFAHQSLGFRHGM